MSMLREIVVTGSARVGFINLNKPVSVPVPQNFRVIYGFRNAAGRIMTSSKVVKADSKSIAARSVLNNMNEERYFVQSVESV